jgi:hypothetical protein
MDAGEMREALARLGMNQSSFARWLVHWGGGSQHTTLVRVSNALRNGGPNRDMAALINLLLDLAPKRPGILAAGAPRGKGGRPRKHPTNVPAERG